MARFDRKLQRRSRGVFLAALGALGAQGRALLPAALAADTLTMRFALSQTATSVLGKVALHFAAQVNRRSNGQLKIEVYPSNQISSQSEIASELANGVIDFAMATSSLLEPKYPQYQVFDLPFLFKDLATGYRVLDGPIGDDLFAALEPGGIVGLGWGTGGFKQLETTTKPIVTPDDMKGLRMRISSGVIFAATYQALGAIPVVIDSTETFLSLTQHIVDAIDNNLDDVTAQKFYTIIKHVAVSNHFISAIPLMASKRRFDALPASLQKLLREEGRALASFARAAYDHQIAADIQILKQNGVVFTDIQYPAFRKATEPVYTQFEARVGSDLLARIRRVAGA